MTNYTALALQLNIERMQPYRELQITNVSMENVAKWTQISTAVQHPHNF